MSAVFHGFAQENGEKISQEFYYSDFVADENGNHLQGVTLKIKGKSVSTKTDGNGECTIKAKIGDMIELSKNGKVINRYRYDGSHQYKVEDNSAFLLSRSKSNACDLFDIHLDSARHFV